MENEDEQKHNIEDAGTSTNCDNVQRSAQSEGQNRYVVRIYSRRITKKAILCYYISLIKVLYKDCYIILYYTFDVYLLCQCRQPTPNFMMGGLIGASPPKFVSFDEIVKAANGMKNMALAHEIAVDKNFQLQKLEPEDGSFHRRVKEIMHKAFWNLLAEQLAEDPPNYSHALVLMKEIKEVIILFCFVITKENVKHNNIFSTIITYFSHWMNLYHYITRESKKILEKYLI